MKRLALRSALSDRAANGHIKVVESFDVWDEPKTKNAVALLEAMEVKGKVLLIAEDHEHSAIKSFRNLEHVIASNLGQANTYDVLWAETVIMSQGTLALGQSAPRGTEEHAQQLTVDSSVGQSTVDSSVGQSTVDSSVEQSTVDSSQLTVSESESEATAEGEGA
jgi:large subunit ribosomal protein L4